MILAVMKKIFTLDYLKAFSSNMTIFRTILVLLICFQVIDTKPKDKSKCTTLAFEGGGTKGIYQVGALLAFKEFLLPEDYQYDFVSGVSVGSLHTLGYMLVNKGNESFLINYLKDKYIDLQPKDMFKNWSGGIIAGILFH